MPGWHCRAALGFWSKWQASYVLCKCTMWHQGVSLNTCLNSAALRSLGRMGRLSKCWRHFPVKGVIPWQQQLLVFNLPNFMLFQEPSIIQKAQTFIYCLHVNKYLTYYYTLKNIYSAIKNNKKGSSHRMSLSSTSLKHFCWKATKHQLHDNIH